MQNRIGPNRVGPAGLLQVLADGLKFIMKEEFVPNYADKVLFIVAPAIGMVCAMLAFAVVPFELFRKADDRLYAAKLLRRNQQSTLRVAAQERVGG